MNDTGRRLLQSFYLFTQSFLYLQFLFNSVVLSYIVITFEPKFIIKIAKFVAKIVCVRPLFDTIINITDICSSFGVQVGT